MNEESHLGILVIEDSATALHMIELWLDEGLGSPYEMNSAETLESGLKLLADGDYDVIVLDLNLPDSEGLDTFYSVRDECCEIPIVIMSGDRDEETAVKAVREGAQDYVVKGNFDQTQLIRPLRFAIERTGRRRAESQLRKSQEQMFLARVVQQGLFPADGTMIPGFDVAGRCDAAESAGGDYFDFVPMLGDKWGVVIGDVSGHGLPAALFMIGARAVLRALVTSYADVGFIISRMNMVLEDDLSEGRFVTLFLLCLDPKEKTFRFANAGHPGFVFDASGNLKLTLDAAEPPIGVAADIEYESSKEISMESGDLLFLYTDGFTEFMRDDGEIYGEERLFEVIRAKRQCSAAEIVDSVFDDLDSFSSGISQFDDVTAVVLKCD